VKTNRLVCMSCLAAAALIASPALSEPQKRAVVTSTSRPQRVGPRTTQVTPAYRHGSMGRYGGTGYYRCTRNYGSNRYYGGTHYYYGDGFGYPYYSSYSIGYMRTTDLTHIPTTRITLTRTRITVSQRTVTTHH
jgi:hypothetical protein